MIVALYKGISLVSWLIRARTWLQGGVYSHASALDDRRVRKDLQLAPGAPIPPADLLARLADMPVVEAWHKGGVLRHTNIAKGHKRGTVVDLFEVRDLPDPAAALLFLSAQVGKPYDYRGVGGFLSRREHAQNRAKWFCSELVFEALLRGGCDLFKRITSGRVSPALVAISPKLYKLGSVVLDGRQGYRAADPSKTPVTASGASRASTHAKRFAANMRPLAAFLRPHRADAVGGRPLAAANEAPQAAANTASAGAAEFVVTQGDTLAVPFGEYPHHVAAVGVQVLDLEAANAVVKSIRTARGKLAARWGGYPVYIGHPDLPGPEGDEYRDKSSYGWVTGAHVDAVNEALVFEVKWSSTGRDLIADARYKFYSPHWGLTIRDASASNRRTAPAELYSIGLTNLPNIPVPPVANTKPVDADNGATNPPKGAHMDPKELAKLLGLAEDATLEQIAEALTAVLADRDNLATQLGELQGANAEAEQAKTEAEAKADAEKENAANARRAHALVLIDGGVADGKVIEADRETWAGQFEANFSAANAKLIALRPLMPTDSKTTGAHKRKTGSGDESVQGQIVTAVNEAKRGISQANPGLRGDLVHQQAYRQVKGEHAEWFTQDKD